jgi:aspartate kinase
MIKVLKFGGSSLASGETFAKVKKIVEADPSRAIVVVSAPGKRFSGDTKVTDLLYILHAVNSTTNKWRNAIQQNTNATRTFMHPTTTLIKWISYNQHND